jgi:hypothetical protein
LRATRHLMSISVTTPTRPGEVEGRDYHFVTPQKFNLMLNKQEFLHARYSTTIGGTPRQPVDEALTEGRDVVFDIDWRVPSSSSSPPARTSSACSSCRPYGGVERRLQSRARDQDVVAKRMSRWWTRSATGRVPHHRQSRGGESVANVQAISQPSGCARNDRWGSPISSRGCARDSRDRRRPPFIFVPYHQRA